MIVELLIEPNNPERYQSKYNINSLLFLFFVSLVVTPCVGCVTPALSIQGKTPTQWESEGHKVVPSPPCMGGSKADPSM